MSEEKIRRLLENLIAEIFQAISDGLGKGEISPNYEPYFRWKLKEFEYNDNGITKKSAEGQNYLKPYWGRVAQKLHQQISKFDIYIDILNLVSKDYQIKGIQSNYFLPTFFTRVAIGFLDGGIRNAHDAEKYIDSLIADLKDERQEYRAEVQLKGIVIQPRSIKLDADTKLRRPNRNDFERGEPISIPHFIRRLEDPTAFLYTKTFAKADDVAASHSMEFQNQIDRQVAVLRLFRVGAVQDIQIANSTDSIIHIAGGTQTRGRLLGPDKYLVTRQDVTLLKRYYKNMKKVELPSSVYSSSQKTPDHLSIAYDKYKDSLEQGVIEKRISDAIMGLEALYLTEVDELPYRLSMRVAKVLNLVNSKYDPAQVKNNVRDAYNKVRNKYVHGEILKAETKKKLEQQHGDLTQFAITIIDYLRASIVAFLKRPIKSSFIQRVDDCFLDSKVETEIVKSIFMPY